MQKVSEQLFKHRELLPCDNLLYVSELLWALNIIFRSLTQSLSIRNHLGLILLNQYSSIKIMDKSSTRFGFFSQVKRNAVIRVFGNSYNYLINNQQGVISLKYTHWQFMIAKTIDGECLAMSCEGLWRVNDFFCYVLAHTILLTDHNLKLMCAAIGYL